jgi:hypothetical protein
MKQRKNDARIVHALDKDFYNLCNKSFYGHYVVNEHIRCHEVHKRVTCLKCLEVQPKTKKGAAR